MGVGAWRDGKDDWRRSGSLLRHGRLGEPDLAALAVTATGRLVREMLAEPPPDQRCTELVISVHIEIAARRALDV